MKKLLTLFALIMISANFGCYDDGGENELNPAILALMGNYSLTVNVTYTGDYEVDPQSGKAGDRWIYAYLYQSLGLTTRDPEPVYTGTNSSPVTDATPQAITINGIRGGDYYLLVFYNYRSGSNPDNFNDRYELYSNPDINAYLPADADTITIPDTESVDITFSSAHDLDDGSYWEGTAP